MELVRFEPFAGFGNFRSVLHDLFDENHGRSSTRSTGAKWYPAVDVLESKDSYLIRAELPGMKKKTSKWKLRTELWSSAEKEDPRSRLKASNTVM